MTSLFTVQRFLHRIAVALKSEDTFILQQRCWGWLLFNLQNAHLQLYFRLKCKSLSQGPPSTERVGYVWTRVARGSCSLHVAKQFCMDFNVFLHPNNPLSVSFFHELFEMPLWIGKETGIKEQTLNLTETEPAR